jgi:hypothetical protein
MTISLNGGEENHTITSDFHEKFPNKKKRQQTEHMRLNRPELRNKLTDF